MFKASHRSPEHLFRSLLSGVSSFEPSPYSEKVLHESPWTKLEYHYNYMS